MNWRYLGLTIVAVIGFTVAAFGIFFVYPIYKFESWVNSRLEIFAEMPYSAWEVLHTTCAELASTDEELIFSDGSAEYAELPEPVRTLEPSIVWVKPERVSMRFSGGHVRFFHIEFYGDRSPKELELLAEGFFDGVVFPRTDERPIGRLTETRP